MRTAMASTSLETYRALVRDDELEPRERQIMSMFTPATKLSRQQLSELTRLKINCITGRVKSLLEKGVLIEDGRRIDPSTHKPQKLLRLPAGQLEMFG